MRKILSLVLVLSLVFALVACNNEKDTTSEPDTSTTIQTETESTDNTDTQTSETDTTNESSSDTDSPSNSNPTSTETSKPITNNKDDTTSSKLTDTPSTPATSKPAETSKPSETVTSEENTPPQTTTISDKEVFECLYLNYISDFANTSTNDGTYISIEDLIFCDKADAKYEVESIKILDASVSDGRKCEIMQTQNTQKIETIAQFIDWDWAKPNWNVNSIKNAFRIKSPPLEIFEENVLNEYGDRILKSHELTLNIQVVFKNGVTKNVIYSLDDTAGQGGPALGNLSDEYYN